MKRILILGASGFLGKVLIHHFNENFEIYAQSRSKSETNEWGVKPVYWDGMSVPQLTSLLEGMDGVINLIGRSVDCRYTSKNKKAIYDSRIPITRRINEAIAGCKCPPKVFLNASSATVYNSSYDIPQTEYRSDLGSDFSMDIVKDWEKALWDHEPDGVIRTALRTTIVLGRGGGAYPAYRRLVQMGVGGYHGNGAQMVSWIHETDFANAVSFLLHNPFAGPINLASPKPVCNKVFMTKIADQLNQKWRIPSPVWLIKLGAFLARTESELLLKSRYVVPEKLLYLGFKFHFEDLDFALINLED